MTKTIEQRIEAAYEMHALGFNCAQCVALATADLVGLDEDLAFRMTEGLGGGLGGFTETCGAVNGGAVVLSFARSSGMELHNSKPETYAVVKGFVEEFRAECGNTLCASLRPAEKELVRPTCEGYIAKGIQLTCKHLEANGLI